MATLDEAIAARIRALLQGHSMSQTELARRVGIDPTGLSRALSGERTFKAREIALIAEQFGVSTSTILEGETTPNRTAIAARQSESNGTSLRAGLDRAHFFVELAEQIESRHPLDLQSFQGERDLTFQAGQMFAAEVLSQKSLDGEPLPTAMHELAALVESRLGIQVALEPLGTGLDGLSVQCPSFGLAMISSSVAPARQRWTLAHEVGHLLFGDTQDLLVDKNVYSRTPQESRANAFAAAFLMPPAVLRQEWGETTGISEEHIADLLGTFGVSLDALAFRLHNLGCVNAQGRDSIRGLRPLISLIRNQGNRQSEGYWLPTPLTSDAIAAFGSGRLGVQWLAALLQLDADELLARLQSDKQEAEALEAEDEMLVG